MAAGPEEPPAAGAFEKLVMVVKDVLRHPALHLLPGNGDERLVAAAATAQGLDLFGGNYQVGEDFLQLGLGIASPDEHQVRALQRPQGLLPGKDESAGGRGRQLGAQAPGLGVEAAKPEPFGQAAQGQVDEELHSGQWSVVSE